VGHATQHTVSDFRILEVEILADRQVKRSALSGTGRGISSSRMVSMPPDS
jgi:hypothetical protein